MIVAAVLAGLLNLVALRSGDDRVRVAVAASPLPAGQPVAAHALRYAELAADPGVVEQLLQPEQAVDVDGWTAAGDIAEGALVRRGDLRAPAAGDGQRAMSIPLEPAHAVGGALAAGDRVDVIDVRTDAAEYVVTDAEVLGVSRSAGGPGLAGLGGFSITVAVDDGAALRLALAIRNDAVEVVRATGAAPVGVKRVERQPGTAAEPGPAG